MSDTREKVEAEIRAFEERHGYTLTEEQRDTVFHARGVDQ